MIHEGIVAYVPADYGDILCPKCTENLAKEWGVGIDEWDEVDGEPYRLWFHPIRWGSDDHRHFHNYPCGMCREPIEEHPDGPEEEEC